MVSKRLKPGKCVKGPSPSRHTNLVHFGKISSNHSFMCQLWLISLPDSAPVTLETF